MFYAVRLPKDTDGSWLVDVPALPLVHTHGATREETLRRAVNAVLTGLEMLVDDKAEIPRPLQSAPAKGTAKLDWHLPQVDRLIDFRHQSKLDQIEQALAVLWRRLVVTSAA